MKIIHFEEYSHYDRVTAKLVEGLERNHRQIMKREILAQRRKDKIKRLI